MEYSRKLLCEFIGAFFLVLTIGVTCLATAPGVIPPIAIGFVLMVMVYAGGHVSGAHYNPAVSVALAVRGKFAWAELPGYVVVQCVAGLVAGLLAIWLKGIAAATVVPAPDSVLITEHKLVCEFLYTFALAYVVVNVATAKAYAGNSFFGLAIGCTVMVGAFAVGPISGGSFNPAVTGGVALMGMLSWNYYALYVLAEVLGGAVAGGVFRLMNPEDV